MYVHKKTGRKTDYEDELSVSSVEASFSSFEQAGILLRLDDVDSSFLAEATLIPEVV